MNSSTLTPIESSTQPTSHVTVGRSVVSPSTDVVRVRHRDRRAFFEVETENDRLASTIKGKVRVAPEPAEGLFGGVDNSPFYVEDGVQRGTVRRAERVDQVTALVVDGLLDRLLLDSLAEALRSRVALVHPIHERYDFGGQTVEFVVTDVEPEANTLRIDSETEIEFSADTERAHFSAPTAGDDAGGGAAGHGGEADSTEAEPKAL